MVIPCILKGEDSSAITFTLSGDKDYTGMTLVVSFQGVTKSFYPIPSAKKVYLSYTHDETSAFNLGTYPLYAKLVLSNGQVDLLENADMRIKVTDCIAEVNAGSDFNIVSAGSGIVLTNVDWSDVTNKPTVVTSVNGQHPDSSGAVVVVCGTELKQVTGEDGVYELLPTSASATTVASMLSGLSPENVTLGSLVTTLKGE